RFPAYLQQLHMESNGKRVRRDGRRVSVATAPVLWGEPGSNAQHSFYQLLHQGTRNVAVDFLASVQASGPSQAQHDLALANLLAQARALSEGGGQSPRSGDRPLIPEPRSGDRPLIESVIDTDL